MYVLGKLVWMPLFIDYNWQWYQKPPGIWNIIRMLMVLEQSTTQTRKILWQCCNVLFDCEVQIYPLDHLNLNRSVGCTQPQRTNSILETLTTKCTQQAFTDSSRSFIVCDYRLWASLHGNDSNKREKVACLKSNVYPANGTHHRLRGISGNTSK